MRLSRHTLVVVAYPDELNPAKVIAVPTQLFLCSSNQLALHPRVACNGDLFLFLFLWISLGTFQERAPRTNARRQSSCCACFITNKFPPQEKRSTKREEKEEEAEEEGEGEEEGEREGDEEGEEEGEGEGEKEGEGEEK